MQVTKNKTEDTERRISARVGESGEEIELTIHGYGDTIVFLTKRLAHDAITALNEAISDIGD